MIFFSPYAYTLDDSGWELDDCHVQLLFDTLMEVKPKVVVEIGSFRGRSAIAYMEALKAGAKFSLHLIEPSPQASLLRLIEESGFKDRVKLHEKPYWELLIPADFVFVDGDHSWPCIADVLAALTMGVKTIAMHDTRSHECGYPGTWGSHMVAQMLEASPSRTWVEDAGRRPGMRTERGFGISTLKD